jgi:hypothetical protein
LKCSEILLIILSACANIGRTPPCDRDRRYLRAPVVDAQGNSLTFETDVEFDLPAAHFLLAN